MNMLYIYRYFKGSGAFEVGDEKLILGFFILYI